MQEKSQAAGRLAVVIPALNEARTIGPIVQASCALPFVCEVIVVDDGSSDATATLAAAAGASVLRQPTNLGKGASLRAGMSAVVARGAALVATLDGDGQHRPEDLGRMLAAARSWPDRIVVGSRRASSEAAPRARRMANRVADFWISWASGHPIDDSQSGFRVYPAGLIGALAERPPLAGGFAFESEVLIEAARLGFRTASVDIPSIYGGIACRASHFRPVADITRIVLMVGSKLLRRGLDPAGLWRSLTVAPVRAECRAGKQAPVEVGQAPSLTPPVGGHAR